MYTLVQTVSKCVPCVQMCKDRYLNLYTQTLFEYRAKDAQNLPYTDGDSAHCLVQMSQVLLVYAHFVTHLAFTHLLVVTSLARLTHLTRSTHLSVSSVYQVCYAHVVCNQPDMYVHI